ncbi:hypothetical protein LCGC14_3122230, partial [marine sediment metagenome]
MRIQPAHLIIGRRRLRVLSSREFPETHPSLLAALDGSRGGSSWLEFYHRYAPAVFRVARLRGLDQHDAEDIVQQTMLSISRHISAFDYDRDRGTFRSWVRRIAESRIVDFARRRPAPTIPLEMVDQTIDGRPRLDELWETQWKLQDLLWCVEQCRNEVSPRTFAAFRLYVLEGATATETAEQVGINVNHVYVIRSEVLKRIRRLAEGLGETRQDEA